MVMQAAKQVLADLYSSPSQVRTLARASGIPPRYLTLIGNPAADISSLLTAAQAGGKLNDLLKTAMRDHPHNPWLRSAMEGRHIPQGRDISDTWHAPQEVLTTGRDLMVPVSWLDKGSEAARAVVRVRIGNTFGSGIVVDGLYLVTNNHVLGTAEEAAAARIDFYFEDGGKPWTTGLHPKDMFSTDPDLDLTVCAIIDHTSEAPDFRLDKVDVARTGDHCQIIQHPAGQWKRLGVYNNLVTYADEKKVQYMTDTMPGSSGSPVFDEDWNLIAIHRSGGWMKMGLTEGTGYANEGVPATYIEGMLDRHAKP